MKKCKLCQLEKPLIKKSHIIPDLFYREAGAYNDKHFIHKIETQNFLKNKSFSYIPTGEYEGGILCETCENNILGGDLETYGGKVLFGGLPPENDIRVLYNNPEYTTFENVDYKKFKLFLLSILWRTAISKRKTFSESKISADNEEKLRKMIFDGIAGEEVNFPIFILSYLRDKTAPSDLIAQPIKSSTKDNDLITIMLAGFVFIFNITDNYKDVNAIKGLTLTPEGKFTILHIPNGEAEDFILKYANFK